MIFSFAEFDWAYVEFELGKVGFSILFSCSCFSVQHHYWWWILFSRLLCEFIISHAFPSCQRMFIWMHPWVIEYLLEAVMVVVMGKGETGEWSCCRRLFDPSLQVPWGIRSGSSEERCLNATLLSWKNFSKLFRSVVEASIMLCLLFKHLVAWVLTSLKALRHLEMRYFPAHAPKRTRLPCCLSKCPKT